MNVPAGRTVTSERREPSRDPEPPFGDVGLLLFAHAEHGWLSREVEPVVRQIEARAALSPQQLTAARAYLEVVWGQARERARRTDDSREQLRKLVDAPQICDWACRYHAAVCELRERLAARIAPLLAPDSA
jgi:hypothetical protein